MSDNTLFNKYGQEISSGRIIFREGDEGTQMFIIQEGKVRITKQIGGKEHILTVLGKGDFFGEMAIVNLVKRTATATAVGNVKLLAFDRQGFVGMIEKNAKIALNIIDKLCRRLQNANVQIQHLVKRNEKGLVAINLYYAFMEKGMENASLALDRTVDDISVILELPAKKVTDYLEELHKETILSIDANTIRLLDKAALEKLTESVRAGS